MEDIRIEMENLAIKQLENKSLDENYNLIDVSYIGEIELMGQKKKIFVFLEEKQNENGESILIEKYYTEDLEFVAAKILNEESDIVLSSKYLDEENLVEILKALREEQEISLSELEKNEIEKIAEALGIAEEEVENVVSIDDEKEVPDISKEDLAHINIKQEIKTNTMVTDKQNMEQILRSAR